MGLKSVLVAFAGGICAATLYRQARESRFKLGGAQGSAAAATVDVDEPPGASERPSSDRPAEPVSPMAQALDEGRLNRAGPT